MSLAILHVLICLCLIAVVGQESGGRPGWVVKSVCDTCKADDRECYQTSSERKHWCCMCPPGHYKAKDCSATNTKHDPRTTECLPCTFNNEVQTYMDRENNAAECLISRRSCDEFVYTRLVVRNRNENNKCVCVDGTFAPVNPEIEGCKPYLQCPKGYGVDTNGNSTHDVRCEKCTENTFSDVVSSTARCKEFTNCKENEIVKFIGNSERDRECISSNFTVETTIPNETGTPIAIASENNAQYNGISGWWLLPAIIIPAAIVFVVMYLRYVRKPDNQPERQTNDMEMQIRKRETRRNQRRVNSNSENGNNSNGAGERSEEKESLLDSKNRAGDESNPSEERQTGVSSGGTPGERVLSTAAHVHKEKNQVPDQASPANVEDISPKEQKHKFYEEEVFRKFGEKGFKTKQEHMRNCPFTVLKSDLRENETVEGIRQRVEEYRRHSTELTNFHSWDLRAVCTLYQVNIAIIHSQTEVRTDLTSPNDNRIIYLGHHINDGENYYILLEKENQGDALPENVPSSDQRVDVEQYNSSPNDQLAASIQPTTSLGNTGQTMLSNDQPSTSDPPSSISDSGQSTSLVPTPNESSAGLKEKINKLFSHKDDLERLSKMPIEHVEKCLEVDSDKCVKFMLDGLENKMKFRDLKQFIRLRIPPNRKQLIEDIEEDNAKEYDKRVKLMKEIKEDQGRALTPEFLLGQSKNYEVREMYDNLCKSFLDYAENEL